MEDVYIVRDEKRIMALRGHRSGEQRRQVGPSPRLKKFGSKLLKNRRDTSDRRHKAVLSFRDRLFERISCLTNGIALLAVGLFFFLTGLTFLPIVGLFVGGYIIIQSFIVMAESLHKVE
ncbi:hypothetical protein DSLASN_22430 [Desulfoluna limicola]|uniref:YrhK domain-containing protein n=1 Tax=Desulfoluna limicola TaxID=2810562 RepID=A0ABN6F3U9_9BACT|nr:hypothetical protein [Desulfoluna limicola]BCS96611.1 hypothetical protein DSLASN_22430 [Desulfoluna limicola]